MGQSPGVGERALTIPTQPSPLRFKVQWVEGVGISAPHALQTICANIVVQLELIAFGIKKIDALGNAVVNRGSDLHVVGFERLITLF